MTILNLETILKILEKNDSSQFLSNILSFLYVRIIWYVSYKKVIPFKNKQCKYKFLKI